MGYKRIPGYSPWSDSRRPAFPQFRHRRPARSRAAGLALARDRRLGFFPFRQVNRPEAAPAKAGGSQFTSLEFTQALQDRGVKISMDGKGRCADNIFVERLWRTLKYEEVCLKAYANATEARREVGTYFRFYNNLRPHQALGCRTPAEVFHGDQTVREEESEDRRCSPGTGPALLAGAPGLSLNSVQLTGSTSVYSYIQHGLTWRMLFPLLMFWASYLYHRFGLNVLGHINFQLWFPAGIALWLSFLLWYPSEHLPFGSDMEYPTRQDWPLGL